MGDPVRSRSRAAEGDGGPIAVWDVEATGLVSMKLRTVANCDPGIRQFDIFALGPELAAVPHRFADLCDLAVQCEYRS